MLRAERTTRLLEEDPELGRELASADLAEATRMLTAPVAESGPGPWALPPGVLGGLILDGVITREVTVCGNAVAQLLGPGDLLGGLDEIPSSVPVVHRFVVRAPARIALLDLRLIAALRRWPRVGGTLLARATAQLERLAVQNAVCQLPRVEERILALLWTVAERWGRVTPDGIVLRIELTHELIGRLVGARRPTVSITLKDLAERDLVRRRPDRSWLLLEPPGVAAPQVGEALVA